MSNNPQRRVTPNFGINEVSLGMFAAAVVLVGAVLWSAHGPSVEKTDFTLTYVGAKLVNDGLGSRLYDIEFQKHVRDALFHHPNPLFFEHPPFEAALLSPLAALPFRTAYLIWGLLNAATWLAVMFFMRAYLPSPREDLGYITMWLLFAPLGVALYQGQSSIIVLAAFAASLVFLIHSRELAAGAVLGIGLFKFQFILPFALVFLFRRKWRYVAGVACTGAFFAVLSLAAIGWQGITQYARFVLAIGKNPQDLSYGSAVDMPTIYGFVYATMGTKISHAALSIISGGLSLAVLFWIAQRWEGENSADYSMYAAGIAASLLAGSHMFTHDFSPLALGLFIATACIRTVPDRLRGGMFFTIVVFWLPPIYFILVGTHLLYLMCPVLFLFAVSLVLSKRHGGSTRAATRLVASA